MMDLLDRYLNTIRWNLPRGANATDILAELHDVIGARIEEREGSLGRPLRDDELSGLLRDFGHPLVVAARYGQQQSLIGPEVFPFYWFSLKVVLAICLAAVVLSGVAHTVFGARPVHSLLNLGGDAFWTLLGNAGLVTLIFAIIERTGLLTRYLEKWKPEELPDLPDLRVKPQSAWESLFEIAIGIAFILWWAGAIPVQLPWTNAKGLTVTPDPVWMQFWLPILILASARLVCSLVAWARPRWKTIRAVLSVGTTIGSLALAALLYRAGHWVTATSATIPAEKLAKIDQSTNLGIHWAIIVVAVIWVFQCAKELWRIYGSRR
jgi:hypothetical protein